MDAVKVAEAIISEAKARLMINSDMPASDDEKIKLARHIVDAARVAEGKAKGSAAEAVRAVLALASGDGDVNCFEQGEKENIPEPSSESDADVQGDVLDTTRESLTRDSFLINGEGIPAPGEVQDDVDPIPVDVTKCSDLEIRKLYSASNAVSARCKWLVSIEDGRLSAAKRTLEGARRRARQAVPKDRDDGKQRLAADIDADVESDSDVQHWRALVAEHEDNLRNLKALRDIHDGDCDRLSREWTMRSEEFVRAGGLGPKGARKQ